MDFWAAGQRFDGRRVHLSDLGGMDGRMKGYTGSGEPTLLFYLHLFAFRR